MSDTDSADAVLARIAAHFPGAEGAFHKLAGADPAFRDLCEDYQLALSALAAFLARPDATERREVLEYRMIVTELQTEIDHRLKTLIER